MTLMTLHTVFSNEMKQRTAAFEARCGLRAGTSRSAHRSQQPRTLADEYRLRAHVQHRSAYRAHHPLRYSASPSPDSVPPPACSHREGGNYVSITAPHRGTRVAPSDANTGPATHGTQVSQRAAEVYPATNLAGSPSGDAAGTGDSRGARGSRQRHRGCRFTREARHGRSGRPILLHVDAD